MPDEQAAGGGGLVPPALLSRLEERIREDLDESPPTRDSGILRREIAELLPRAGAVGLYEDLGISVGATTGEVTAAFIDLGRRVHPSLAGWVDLPEGVLRLLFEHAAHAYLVLSDPVRRKDYDREHPTMPEAERRSDEELGEGGGAGRGGGGGRGGAVAGGRGGDGRRPRAARAPPRPPPRPAPRRPWRCRL